MACRSAGKLFNISVAAFMTVSGVFCGRMPANNMLDPRLTFSIGSRFLRDAPVLALKGKIEFFDGQSTQSGSFRLFLNGHDSLAFLIEGPLGVDVFRMSIVDDLAYLRSNEDASWNIVEKGERASIAEYGIENISPFLAGLYIFPQYYLDDAVVDESALELTYRFDNYNLDVWGTGNDREFQLSDPESGINSLYSRRKEFGDGYFPSAVTIFDPNDSWQIRLMISSLKLNPLIPSRVWKRD